MICVVNMLVIEQSNVGFGVSMSFGEKIFARPAESEVVDVELVDEIQVHEHAEGGLPR